MKYVSNLQAMFFFFKLYELLGVDSHAELLGNHIPAILTLVH
jgi:hypothetical protein